MADHGLLPGACVYVADSAFFTVDNLNKADANRMWFVIRLPATYRECGREIQDAVAVDEFISP
jgi:transposase